MKVFEVKSQYSKDDGTIVEVVQYVTHENNDLLSVTEYYTRKCDETEEDLKSVREVIVIVQHIKAAE